MLYYLGYVVMMATGGITNLLSKEKQIVAFVVCVGGGLAIAISQHDPYTWFCYLCYITGWGLCKAMIYQRKTDKKKNEGRQLYNHYFTKDANGNYKLNSFKIIDGGRR